MAEPDLRFSLANERTLLAYHRTAIGLIAAAVAIAHFLDGLFAGSLAAALLATAAVAAIGGFRRFRAAEHAIRAGEPMPAGPTPGLLTAGVTTGLLLGAASVLVTLH